VATPNRLLDSHPSLRRLKEGLIDAQLRTSHLQGTMSAEHPKVIAAKEAEEEIGRNLHAELSIARRGVEVELRMNADRGKLLKEQLTKTNERLHNLAAVRAGYANQVAAAKNRTDLLERAEHSLAEARASRASAKVASLISRIDTPDAGIRPVGPSRMVIALSGLLAGLGIVFLSVPATPAAAAVESQSPTVAYVMPSAGKGCNGFGTKKTAARVNGCNGSNASKNIARVNGRTSLRKALQTLGE
jgi:uncharacterized protein involved in exopolysaccharide biosynthesis